MFRNALLPTLPILAWLVLVPAGATPSGSPVAVDRRTSEEGLRLQAPAGSEVDPFDHLPWTPTGGRPYAHFGRRVAPAGDVNRDGYGDVLVSAPGDSLTIGFEGRVYLYLGSANGLSTVPAWSTGGGQGGAEAGLGLAPAGDVNGDGYADVLIGMQSWDSAQYMDVGRVFVFHGGPTGLALSPNRTLTSPSPNIEQFFGLDLDTAGDVNGDGYDDIIIGGPNYGVGAPAQGAAWIWHGSPSGVPPNPQTTLVGRVQSGGFGYSVSHAGDVDADGYADVIVGAPTEDGPLVDCGAVSFYRGSPGGILAVPDTTLYGWSAQARFGHAVTGLGDFTGEGYADFAVGSPTATFDGQPVQSGMVRRYYGGPQGVSSGDVTLGPFVVAHENYGTAVETLGDVNGDGRPDYAASGRHAPLNTGRVGVVLGDGDEGVFGPTAYPPPGSSDNWGLAFATSGDVNGDGVSEILFGDAAADVGPTTRAGRAFLYAMKPPAPTTVLGWNPRTGPQPGTGYGQALAVLPAFIGSSAAIAVGDPGYDGGGRVSLHLASGQRSLPTVESFHFGTFAGSFWSLGARLVDAGDVNRDGATDLVFSTPTLDFVNAMKQGSLAGGAVSQAGRVQFVLGGPDAILNPMTLVFGASDFDRVGTALAGRGDVNGDGYHDVLVGAAGWDAPGITNAGKIWVCFGGPAGFTNTPWTATGTTPGQGLGASVALGDLDGDGYSDVIAGSVHPELEPSMGRVRVWYGAAGGPPANPGLVLEGQPSTITYGWAVAALGDVNGDAICDLGVGAPDEDGVGRVYLYAGTRGRSQSRIPIWSAKGFTAGCRFGEALAGGGDLDGDGLADFAIGAPSLDGLQVNEGQVRLYRGAAPVPASQAAAMYGPGISGALFGASFAPFADFNSDGFADLVIGAPGAAGRVYVLFGNGPPGERRQVRILEIVDGELQFPRFHPSRLGLPNHAQARLPRIFPAGRRRIQAEFEIRHQNAPFTGLPTSRDPAFLQPGLASSLPIADVDLPSFLPGRGYHLRSRWVSRSPYFQRTRWTAPEGHASGDLDFWTSGAVVSVDPPADGLAPRVPRIARVVPNPGGRSRGGETRIDFALPAAGPLSLDLYAVNGARVRRLYSGAAPAGPGAVAWDGRDEAGTLVPPGVYFVELRAAGRADRAKLVRLP